MPFCIKCRFELKNTDQFCPSCGTPNVLSSDKQKDVVDGTIIGNSGNYGESISELPAEFIIDNRYKIEQRLGSGGFGTVYKAWDQDIGCWKALKIIHSEYYDGKEVIHDLTREAKLLMEIHAENIVRLWDIHLQGNLKYIDMEYVDDGDLLDLKLRYENKKVPEQKVVELARQIATGMMKIHQKKIIHKDLKPQNIMLTKDGTVKIMDFGISEKFRSSVSRIKDTSRSGTPRYMAPEHILGEDVGREADVWSFGIIIYELLYGRQPFVADNRNDILLQIEKRKFKPLENVSEKVNELLWKCLQKDYHDRFRNFDEIYEYLNNNEVVKIESKIPEIEKNKPIPSKNIQQPKIADNVLSVFKKFLDNKKEVNKKQQQQLKEIKQKTNKMQVINPPKTFDTKEMTQKKIKEFWSLIDSNWRRTLSHQLGKSELKISDIPEILKIKKIKKNIINESINLNVISYLTELEILEIEFGKRLDFKPISNTFNLTRLKISNYRSGEIVDLRPIKNLINLNYLKLDRLMFKSFSFIKNLANLEELHLNSNNLTSLVGLENCVNLKILIVGYNKITDLTPIMNLHNLEKLSIQDGIDAFDFELNHPNCVIDVL